MSREGYDGEAHPSKLNGNRNPIGAGVIPILRGVENDRGDEETNRDSPLVATNNGASDPFLQNH